MSRPLLKLRTLSLFIALVLTLSLASMDAGASPKAKKSSSRAKGEAAKGKAAKGKSKNNSRASARRGNSRSRSIGSRGSRRGGRFYARSRGRRSRWRRQVASAGTHGVGVHNYLSNAWTQEIGPSDKRIQPGDASNPTASSGVGDVNARIAPQPATSSADEVTRPRIANIDPTAEPPMNPLVAAYTDSLATFGFSAENQGFIVTTLKGEVLAEHNADRLFNPASVTKIATSLTAISRLGPDFKFRTALYTDGTLDHATGILHGSLYVVGSGDPALFPENAMMI